MVPCLRHSIKDSSDFSKGHLMRGGAFARRRRVVGNGVKGDAVLARGLEATWNRIPFGIADHESSKGPLQRVGGAVLLFERSERHFFQFDLLSQCALEDFHG